MLRHSRSRNRSRLFEEPKQSPWAQRMNICSKSSSCRCCMFLNTEFLGYDGTHLVLAHPSRSGSLSLTKSTLHSVLTSRCSTQHPTHHRSSNHPTLHFRLSLLCVVHLKDSGLSYAILHETPIFTRRRSSDSKPIDNVEAAKIAGNVILFQ